MHPITFDKAKRDKTLAERGLDFTDAALVFDGPTATLEDTRKVYGEPLSDNGFAARSSRHGGMDTTQGITSRDFDEVCT